MSQDLECLCFPLASAITNKPQLLMCHKISPSLAAASKETTIFQLQTQLLIVKPFFSAALKSLNISAQDAGCAAAYCEWWQHCIMLTQAIYLHLGFWAQSYALGHAATVQSTNSAGKHMLNCCLMIFVIVRRKHWMVSRRWEVSDHKTTSCKGPLRKNAWSWNHTRCSIVLY